VLLFDTVDIQLKKIKTKCTYLSRSKGGVESSSSIVYGKFDDTKGVIRSRNWKMDRQYKKLIVLILFKSFKKRYPVDSYQRVQNMLVKSCKSMGKLWFNSNTTGVARGVGTAYPSKAIECIAVFSGFILFNLK
jgi:hypothetical protein